MRVPFSWLKEFAPVGVCAREAAEKLREVGVPVTGVEILREGIRGVHSGKIVSLEAHPDADKLRVAQVDLKSEKLQIVTGASNVAVGDIVPVAKIGACLSGGKRIVEVKLRGLPSYGMMCSADELGLDMKEHLPPEQRRGVLVLDPETAVGADLGSLLGLEEAVLILEPFANRPDFLSVFGLAREAAAAFGVPLQFPQLDAPAAGSLSGTIKIEVEDKTGCPRYTARYIPDVRVRPSPLWMAVRLSAAGVRPINNIVDVTNYVLLELGQPLHAFDYDTLAEKTIRVRPARAGERLRALDGKTYELAAGMLVIADGKKPVGLAGIMGGVETEISDSTRRVLLESAAFNPGLIRRTSLKLGLRTESSRRFEKGIDKRGAEWGSRRACRLLKQAGFPADPGGADVYETLPPAREINVRFAFVKKILGTPDLERDSAKKILSGLGFQVRGEDPLVVEPPVFRGDVCEEIDVAEEIARHYGYERIPVELPRGAAAGTVNSREAFEAELRGLLSAAGLTEVITYSLGDPAVVRRFYPDSLVLAQNPPAEDRKALRPLLYPEILLCAGKNLRVKNRNLCFFEVGKVFRQNGEILEKRHAAAVLTGRFSWGKEVSFYTLKGLVELLWRRLHIGEPLVIRAETRSNFHPKRLACFGTGKEDLGFFGELHPQIAESLDLDQSVMVLELDVDILQNLPRKMSLAPIPVFPESRRDISVVLGENTPAGEVQEAIRQAGRPLLEEVRVFDVYQGSQIPAGKKSIAFSLIYRAAGRTLTDEEVNRVHEKILSELGSRFQTTLRR